MQTTLGTQFKLQEGHYVHHFSVNPGNLDELTEFVDNGRLTGEDIAKLKEALRCGVTYYDSSSKAGTENEALLMGGIERRVEAGITLFRGFDRGKCRTGEIDFAKVSTLLSKEKIKMRSQN